MTWWEILLLVAVCVGFVAALGVSVYNKIKGKSGCDCGGSCNNSDGCDGCCAHCRAHKAYDDPESRQKE